MPQGGMDKDPREMDASPSSRTDGERTEGRPSEVPPATPADTGRPDPVREGSTGTAGTEGTVAPEERGEEPETEHAPGADL